MHGSLELPATSFIRREAVSGMHAVILCKRAQTDRCNSKDRAVRAPPARVAKLAAALEAARSAAAAAARGSSAAKPEHAAQQQQQAEEEG